MINLIKNFYFQNKNKILHWTTIVAIIMLYFDIVHHQAIDTFWLNFFENINKLIGFATDGLQDSSLIKTIGHSIGYILVAKLAAYEKSIKKDD